MILLVNWEHPRVPEGSMGRFIFLKYNSMKSKGNVTILYSPTRDAYDSGFKTSHCRGMC